MKKIKLFQKSAGLAALLFVASTAAQATPATPLDVLWQWLFQQPTPSEQKYCTNFPDCEEIVAPTPETDPTQTT